VPRKAEGMATLVLPWEAERRRETFTCNHCDAIKPVLTKDRLGHMSTDGRHWCSVCDSHVCNKCINEARDHRCVVWERKMEIMEARGAFIADVMRVAS
jgi:hypothetical protein